MWFFVDEDVHIKDTIGALTKWTKDYGKKETHEILGGVFGGELLDAKGVDAVGKLPTKQELMGRLAFALQEAGAARIVRCINQVPTKLARGIKLAKEEDAEEGTVAALAVGGQEVEGQSPLSPDLVEAQAEEGLEMARGSPANFRGLVLGCIETNFCNQILVRMRVLFEKRLEKKWTWKRTMSETEK